ncbi:ERVV2 protein, partial [Rostratula benghalensis]|nr:ERVV2 protein [Rostratula benghalensis]NXJ72949.1 ERVV2 protein [Rostratula benghalensis]
LASQGGVCTIINTSCCTYVDQSGRVATDLQEIWEQTKILREVTKDDTPWGFSELWDKLTSWFPNLAWLKTLFMTIMGILIMGILITISIKCLLWCCRSTRDTYSTWKRHQLRQKLESNKYFERV